MKKYYKLPVWEKNETTYRDFRASLSQVRDYGHGIELVPIIDYSDDEHSLHFLVLLKSAPILVEHTSDYIPHENQALAIKADSSADLAEASYLFKKGKFFPILYNTIECLWPIGASPLLPLSFSTYNLMCDHLWEESVKHEDETLGMLFLANLAKLQVPRYIGDPVPKPLWRMKA